MQTKIVRMISFVVLLAGCGSAPPIPEVPSLVVGLYTYASGQCSAIETGLGNYAVTPSGSIQISDSGIPFVAPTGTEYFVGRVDHEQVGGLTATYTVTAITPSSDGFIIQMSVVYEGTIPNSSVTRVSGNITQTWKQVDSNTIRKISQTTAASDDVSYTFQLTCDVMYVR